MPPDLLDSQFAALEEPGLDEPAIRVEIGPTPQRVAQTVVDKLGLKG